MILFKLVPGPNEFYTINYYILSLTRTQTDTGRRCLCHNLGSKIWDSIKRNEINPNKSLSAEHRRRRPAGWLRSQVWNEHSIWCCIKIYMYLYCIYIFFQFEIVAKWPARLRQRRRTVIKSAAMRLTWRRPWYGSAKWVWGRWVARNEDAFN